MKKKGFISAVLLVLLLCSSALAYEISVEGEIPLNDRVNAVAFNPATGKGAAINSESKAFYIFDLPSLRVVHTLSFALVPTAVTIDQKRNAAIISFKDGTPRFIDLDSGGLVKIAATGWDIYSLAVNIEDDSLYVGRSDSIAVINLETGSTLKEVPLSYKPIGMGLDTAAGSMVVIVEGKDGLSLNDAGTFETIAEIRTGTNPSGVAVNPSTRTGVLANNKNSSLSIVSVESRTVLATLPFEQPRAVAIDPTRNVALIGHETGITVVQLENPIPKIESLVPESSQAGSPGLTLSIKGTRFISDSKAKFNLRELETLFEDNSSLKALVPSDELLSAREVPVSVLNPAPGGGLSNSLLFRIINPVPQIESLSPDTVALTVSPTEIRMRGKNFLPGSAVNLNGRNLETKFISSILLSAQLDISGIKVPARYPVTVINPSPVSLTSNVVFLNVVEDASLISIADIKKKEALTDESTKTTGTLTGRILNTSKQPIEGVTVQIKNIKAETDFNGYFTLNDVPSGKQHLMIHGETASKKDEHHPTIPLTVYVAPDKINNMPFQIYLHRQKNRNFKNISSNEDTILTDLEVPGFEMRIPRGVKITGWDGKPNLKVSVTTVPTDRLPVKPLPDNANVRTVYMFYFDKIGGGIPDQPIPVKARNDLGLLPGEKAVLWYYDESPNEGEAPNDWAIAGTGTVTPDGRFIVSDPGVGIPKFCCGAISYGGTGSGSGGSGGGNGCGEGGCCGGDGPGGSGGGGDDGGGGFGGGPEPGATSGDPVDLATGYFIYRHADYSLPGSIPVKITRHYRSGDSVRGGYGDGTYFGYDWWIGDYGDMLLLLIPGNYQYRFYKQPDGSFINTTDPKYMGDVFYKNADNTYTLKRKNGWNYKFDSNKLLAEIKDPNGNAINFPEKNDGNISKIATSDGRIITFNLQIGGASGRDIYTKISGPNGTVNYSYTAGKLTSVTYPDGSSLSYEYDANGRMTKISENGNMVVLNEYDSNNRVIRQTHSDGGVYTFSYIVAGGHVTETDMTAPNGAVTAWRFNSYGYITDKTTPDGTTHYERDPGTNQILSVTDPLGRHINYTYDPKGRVTALTDNAGNTTHYEYENTFSKVTRITDALGHITTMSYDASGNMLTSTNPGGATSTFTYNSVGKPLTITDTLNHTSTMEYDASGNLIRVTDPLGNASQMAYDNLGRLVKMTDANGKSTSYNYDAMGRISNVTDPLENITRYLYDLSGKLSQVTDAKNQTISYEYDVRDRLKKMTDQVGKVETYSYNTSDNLVSLTDRKGQTTTYTYDLMNRMTRATYADGSYTAYTYDVGGRLTAINDSVSGSISHTYSGTGCGSGCSSAADKVVQEVTPLGTINYTYDAIGRRTSMTFAGQPAVNYSYDNSSHITGISTLNSQLGTLNFNIGYDALGRRTSLSVPNGVTTNYTYDNASRLLTLDHLNPQPLESLSYTYDANGNRISMSRPSVPLPLPQPASNTSYNDANQMLTFTASTSSAQALTYDENGNMTSVTNSCGTTNYTWDVRNRLVGIQGYKPDCSPLTASFKYDALNRRIEKSITDTVNGTRTTDYLYDGLDIVQEKQNGTVTANYIRTLNIDEPLARIKADGTVRYYQTDALGSVIALTDETGVARTKYSYDPFGNVTISGEASDNPFQYTGSKREIRGQPLTKDNIFIYNSSCASFGLFRDVVSNYAIVFDKQAILG